MSQLDEIARNLDAALERLEGAVETRLQNASNVNLEDGAEMAKKIEQLCSERDQLQQENALLRQDAAGLVQRLSTALQRLDIVIAGDDEVDEEVHQQGAVL
ncbi:hypothetical protein [Curvivirga aplysinae]|uniref:hypothetical protein n=1 Tax=Curvivirga aplysinae TaxID=2529852 RepID=UPI0012BC3EC4|nr:hypothetical protein [Curvivirga aplysinae]MTI11090.1 hypothetical protein [Curvivirga aplysinae]